MPRNSIPRELVREWLKRSRNPIKSKMVSDGPCKENKDLQDNIDILKFPTPLWHDRDGGRMIGTRCQVITKDPDSGWINVGTYRMQIFDEKSTGLLARPGWQHIGLHFAKYIDRDEPMPVSVAFGGPPICNLISCQPVRTGQDEFDVAGGIQGEPIELVKSELSDIPVPATAEIVLEGTVDPRERQMEGPFGEYPGYYGSLPTPKPVFRVKCVTYRNDPVFLGSLEGYPMNESHTIMSIGQSAYVLDSLETMGARGVVDAALPRSTGGQLHTIVSIKPMVEGHAASIAGILWGLHGAYGTHKHVIVVDEDIDPWDLDQVFWAISTRVKATESIHIWKRHSGATMDPRALPDEKGFWDRVLIDATRPYEWEARSVWATKGVGKGIPLKFPPVCRPDSDTMDMVNKRWEEYGINPMKDFTGNSKGMFAHWWNSDIIDAIRRLKITP
jgi:4-hydroxy-3-polyprenylbenzoate decarboxylase